MLKNLPDVYEHQSMLWELMVDEDLLIKILNIDVLYSLFV